MTQEHPITPPPELVQQWLGEFFGCTVSGELSDSEQFLAAQAAQWGYKQAVEESETFLRKTVDTIHDDSMTTQINGDKLFVIDRHPAIPPSDLLKKWEDKWFDEEEHPDVLLIQAFQAGADQELEACCTEVSFWVNKSMADKLRTARRPKPPSLKVQALMALEDAVKMADDTPPEGICSDQANIIRRALEQLDD